MNPAPLERVARQLTTAASAAIASLLVASLRRLAGATSAAPAAAPATASGLHLGVPVAPPSRRNSLVRCRLRRSWTASAADWRAPVPCRAAAGCSQDLDAHVVHGAGRLQVPRPGDMAVLWCG